jgi:putative FmdB family regulatory protein
MPIYEYQALSYLNSCSKCRDGFEVIQGPNESRFLKCPHCGKNVKKVISRCHSTVNEKSYDNINAMNKIKEYEKSGMWSHAAELADTHSEKTKDSGLKLRALDNYKKAGYDADSLAKHVKAKKG